MTKYSEAKSYFLAMENRGVTQATDLFIEAESIREILGDIAYARFIINCYEDLINIQLPLIQNS